MTIDLKQKLRSFLLSRQQAYNQVFNIESVFAQTVLLDLARFCRADVSTFHQDPRAHALAEGRREVWLRIQKHIKLDPEQFIAKYGRGIE